CPLPATVTLTALFGQTSPVGNEIVNGSALARATLNRQTPASDAVAAESSDRRSDALIRRSVLVGNWPVEVPRRSAGERVRVRRSAIRGIDTTHPEDGQSASGTRA